MIKQLMLKKLKSLTAEEIITYANEYQLSISYQQADDIANHLKKHNYDPTNAADRTNMIKKLAQITDVKTAQACQKLFRSLVKEYQMEHLFF